MQAIIQTQYGSPDQLQLQEVAKPTPQANEVLIKVFAAAVNPADLHLLRGEPFFLRLSLGIWKPRHLILGSDIAGRVKAVGEDVTHLRPGDAVFGDLSSVGLGGFAEYVSAPAHILALKPANVSFTNAAAAPMAAITALQGLRDNGHIQPGELVLINGASGGVGSFAVQIAKSFGAEVTAVCSTRKVEVVRSLGADNVIDYSREDFTQTGQPYDLIFDTVGNRSLADYRRALSPQGRFVTTTFLPALLLRGLLPFQRSQQVMRSMLARPNTEDLRFIGELLETGHLCALVDRSYPLGRTTDALRYLGEGHAAGKVLISIASEEEPTLHTPVAVPA